jgi:hypothetical protein
MTFDCPPLPCGRHQYAVPRVGHFVETHGLDCGPYETRSERWYECPQCGAAFGDDELAQFYANEEAESARLGELVDQAVSEAEGRSEQ